MIHTFKSRTVLLAFGASLLAMPGSALALDAEALIKRYQATANEQGQEFTYTSVEQSGDNIVVKGPAWILPDTAPIKGETAVLSAVQESDDGSITIGSLDVKTITAGSGDISVTFETAGMKDLRLPAENETDPIKKIFYYTKFSATNGVVSYKGKTVAQFPQHPCKYQPL